VNLRNNQNKSEELATFDVGLVVLARDHSGDEKLKDVQP
jgi:hypothetical protein